MLNNNIDSTRNDDYDSNEIQHDANDDITYGEKISSNESGINQNKPPPPQSSPPQSQSQRLLIW